MGFIQINGGSEKDVNKEAFSKMKALPDAPTEGFVGFVDGDLVDQGKDYTTVALNTSDLRSLRGSGATMGVYDTKSGTSTPK